MAIERANQLHASIAEADVSDLVAHGSSTEGVKIGASIGVACFPVDDQSLSALLEKADAFQRRWAQAIGDLEMRHRQQRPGRK
jgi:predicted signal transduction protein with EAL and GGDEF domain